MPNTKGRPQNGAIEREFVLNADTVFERNADMMVADMDGELVMMDVTQGSYFSINQVGSHVWVKLETPQSVAALVASVSEAFQSAEPVQVSEDVDRFLADLLAHDLIREVAA